MHMHIRAHLLRVQTSRFNMLFYTGSIAQQCNHLLCIREPRNCSLRSPEVKGLSSSPRIALECAGGLNTFLGKHSESGFRRWHAETNSGLIFEVPDIAERGIPRGLAARCSNLQLCGAFLCIQSSKPFPTPLSGEDSLPTKI